MPTFSEILKDKKNWPDETKFAMGNGVDMTVGELRAYQDAVGADVGKQLEAEREKFVAEQAEFAEKQAQLSKGQQEVVELYAKLQEAQNKLPKTPAATATPDWRDEPFYAPVAKHMRDVVEAAQAKQAQDIKNLQTALGAMINYAAEVISEQRYAGLPDDFRKATSYADAKKLAKEKNFLDQGGVPDVRRIYEEWESPRKRAAEDQKLQKEAYEKARQDMMASALARPSGVPSGGPVADPNAPHTLRESFNRLKQDPEFNRMIYGLTGEGQA